MDVVEYIKLCMVKRGDISLRQLAELSGQTPQNLQNKISRNNMKFEDIERLAAAMGCDVQLKFIDKNTKEVII